MTTDEDLRRLAEAARPGPWRFEPGKYPCVTDGYVSIGREHTAWDAAFIAAANPQAVLALLDRVAAAEAEVEGLLETLTELAPADEVEVEGSIFQRPDLPRILGNFMRSSAMYVREAKANHLRVEKAEAEVERLNTWDGLMSLLDEHWPEDIFPTTEDREGRDPGARIVSLLRRNTELKATVEATRAALSGHPECALRPDGDIITCGWKRAVADARAALGGEA